jgi:MFS transporter, DHA3 family, macrolide efflux protein
MERRMSSFALIWAGQVVSLVGSGITAFALGVWVYQQTHSATAYTLIALSASLPALLMSPLGGALADRWPRRLAILGSDAAAALGSLFLILMLTSGGLQVWHVYLAVAFGAICNSLQIPAFMAAVTMLAPRRQLGRASGLMQFGNSAAGILSPLLAGVLLAVVPLWSIILLDLATFLFAAVTLFLARIPEPERSGADAVARRSLLGDAAFGWRYIAQRPGLAALAGYFAMLNLLVGMTTVLVTPLVLSFAGSAELGRVQSLGSAGLLTGGLIMTAWGGGTRHMRTILGLSPLLGTALLLVGVRPSVVLIAAGLFSFFLIVPLINGSSQVIWQSKVEPGVQGRVFATRRLIAQGTLPLAYLISGPLADRVFGPLLAKDGLLAPSLGTVLGTGPGRGIGLVFLTMGVVIFACTAAVRTLPRFTRIEEDLPDARIATTAEIPEIGTA